MLRRPRPKEMRPPELQRPGHPREGRRGRGSEAGRGTLARGSASPLADRTGQDASRLHPPRRPIRQGWTSARPVRPRCLAWAQPGEDGRGTDRIRSRAGRGLPEGACRGLAGWRLADLRGAAGSAEVVDGSGPSGPLLQKEGASSPVAKASDAHPFTPCHTRPRRMDVGRGEGLLVLVDKSSVGSWVRVRVTWPRSSASQGLVFLEQCGDPSSVAGECPGGSTWGLARGPWQRLPGLVVTTIGYPRAWPAHSCQAPAAGKPTRLSSRPEGAHLPPPKSPCSLRTQTNPVLAEQDGPRGRRQQGLLCLGPGPPLADPGLDLSQVRSLVYERSPS